MRALVVLLLTAALLAGCQPEQAAPTKPPKAEPPDLHSYTRAIRGAQSKDLSALDLSSVPPAQLHLISFDTKTIWPPADRLPKGFDPKAVLEKAKDPGLGVRLLHQQGITGKAVGVAVIDKPILWQHQEFGSRIRYVEVFGTNPRNTQPHFHGQAAASILAGKTVGVAPGSFLHYYAVPDDGENTRNYARALEQLLVDNESLPPGSRIRVVSISDGMFNGNGSEQWWAALKKARDRGIMVITCEDGWLPARYFMGGASPGRDPNKPEDFELALFFQGRGEPYWVIVPGDYRTFASEYGPDVYSYWAEGGMSWATPWLAGLLALGLQANPTATEQQLFDALTKTATVTAKGLRIVNPAAYIQALKP